MAVKKLDDNIKKAFSELGFTDEEIANGCWLLERKGVKVSWIALHKFLERVAERAKITFDPPVVLSCTEKEVAIMVRFGDVWSIGEASVTNCKNDYRWAMAEKRAKDRVVLKVIGVSGDMYSEEEADEFKKKPEDTAQEIPENKSASEHYLERARDLYKYCADSSCIKVGDFKRDEIENTILALKAYKRKDLAEAADKLAKIYYEKAEKDSITQ